MPVAPISGGSFASPSPSVLSVNINHGAFSTAARRATSEPGSGSSAPTSAPESGTEKLLKELQEYIEKGPVVAMREKILKSMNLSEEELKTLPPEQQEAIEAEIAERIKEMMLRAQGQDSPQTALSSSIGLYRSVAAMNAMPTPAVDQSHREG